MPATITVKGGDLFRGIFFGATIETHESAYLLKMVQQIKLGGKGDLNGSPESSGDYIGAGEDYTMIFDVKDVLDLAIEGDLVSTQSKMLNGRPPHALRSNC